LPFLSEFLWSTDKKEKLSLENEGIESFNLTLEELKQTKRDLALKVFQFLGQIGGNCHQIVRNELE
jgi:hypothetical protein